MISSLASLCAGAALVLTAPWHEDPVVRASLAVPRSGGTDTMTATFETGGVRVLLRRNTANDVVAANLYLLGGTRQITELTAGIEPLLLSVSERGTRHYPRSALPQRMAMLGSRMEVEAREDWTLFGMQAVRSTFDSTWAIFADRLIAPTLDPADVEQLRTQALTGARTVRDSPDALLAYLADSIEFAGHPYALSPAGTERSLRTITVAQLRSYQQTQIVTSRMLLVVVGNVDRAHLEALVGKTLARLPHGNYEWTLPALPSPQRGLLVTVPRDLPTNYILGYYLGPLSTSPDYQALRIAAAVLSGRLFHEIRSRRNLTYAVEAPFVERAIAAGGLYVTTVQPDSTLALMRSEIERLKRELIDSESLPRIAQQFITEYFLNNETNGEQANFLARAALYRGDYHAADRFVDELRHVTPDDVRRVAQRYMHDVRFVYVGDTSRISRALIGF